MIEISQLEKLIKTLNQLFGIVVSENSIKIVDGGVPHKSYSLPKEKMALYIFEYAGTVLKIGKTGSKSNARFNSQHYCPNSSVSNLAKSILSDSAITVSVELNVGIWIKNNVRRIDILLDKDLGIFVLNLYEAALHLKYNPKYEGFKTQSC